MVEPNAPKRHPQTIAADWERALPLGTLCALLRVHSMQNNPHTLNRRLRAFAPEFAVLVLAIFLRLITLGSRDYWHDEVHDILKAQRLKGVLLEGELVSNHPPLFNVLVRIWGTFGDYDNEWYMRALPMMLGVCGVVAIYLLGRVLISRRAGLFAALLLALSPLHVVHSQDFKVYILLPFTGAITGLLLYLAMRDNQRRIWAGYAVMASIACYSDLFAAPLLVSLNLWAVGLIGLRRDYRDRMVPLLVANTVGAVLYLPMLALMVRRAQAIMIDAPQWWVPPPDLAKIYYVYKSAAFGYSDTAPALQLAVVLFTGLFLLGAFAVWNRDRAVLAYLSMWCVLSILQLYLISHIGNSVFLIRGTIPYLIPLWILAGAGIAQLKGSALRVLAAAGMTAVLAVPLFERYTDQYPVLEYPHRPGVHPPMEYRAATDYIRDNWRDGDIVIHATNATWYPMFWYGLRNMPSYHGVVHGWHLWYFIAANPRNTTYADLDNFWPRPVPELVQDAQRIWLVFSEWERMWLRGEETLPSNPTQVWRWLEAHAAQTEYTAFGELEVFLYDYNRGNPPPIHARDHDTGATARVMYGDPINADRMVVRPDNGLVFQPLHERATGLTVAFSDNTGGTDIWLHPNASHQTAFTITNHLSVPAECAIEVVASAALYDLASLQEPDPAQEVWSVGGLYHRGPPRLIGNLLAPLPRPVEGLRTDSLAGRVPTPSGEFLPLIYLLGPGGQTLSLTINGREILPGSLESRSAAIAGDWRWLWGEPVALAGDAGDLVLTARRTDDGVFRSTAAYLALVPLEADPNVISPGASYQQGTLEAIVQPEDVAQFSVHFTRNIQRLDVWVHLLQAPPVVYRIFKPVDDTAGKTLERP